MKYLRWISKLAAPVAPMLTGAVLCQLVLVGIALCYVYISKSLVDVASGVGEGGARELVLLGCAMVLTILLRIGFQSCISYVESKAEIKIANSLRQREFDKLMHLKSDYRKHWHSGDLVNRMQSDVSAVASSIGRVIPNLTGAVLKFSAAFAYMLVLEARLAWLLVLVIPVGVFGGRFVLRRTRALTLAVREGDGKVQSHVQESVQHLPVIQGLEYGANSSSELEMIQDDFYSKIMRRTRFSIVARILTALAFSLGYAIAFLWGVRGIWLGSVSFGLMTAFLQLVGQIQRPLLEMSEQLPSLFHCSASIDRLMEIEAMPGEEEGEALMMDGIAGVRLENLSFHYPDGEEMIFDNFSHDFKPGSRTAVIGETGIGKSTLIKLLMSLLQADSGKITLYDLKGDCAEASSRTRCNMVYVPQGNTLFSGSIRENLLMGKPDADESQMREALHRAAADFVDRMPEGLDSQCFEAGGGLSEGQAQRIAIARALLRPGSILLLDEFSSALDPETEELLLERLNDGSSDKTMIFITHRERVADYCDSILRLDRK
ncbi:MAG: ABC transporter ATP-binding protein [Candidatus Cryptobacteroides sp.]|nr:ABC transporter ATP-binding protein [Candidatus Cryptobacteroides sp.]MDY4630955.1 ABC transporter ATP-binding protein [Candidatus Cryptobacteroides sp.]